MSIHVLDEKEEKYSNIDRENSRTFVNVVF